MYKSVLFDWLETPNISKVVLHREKNSNLKNDALCDVYVFHYVDFADIVNIIGACKVAINNDGRYGELSRKHHAFLNSIQSQKQHGFLSKSMIKKLMDIEIKYRINLNISDAVREIVVNNPNKCKSFVPANNPPKKISGNQRNNHK